MSDWSNRFVEQDGVEWKGARVSADDREASGAVLWDGDCATEGGSVAPHCPHGQRCTLILALVCVTIADHLRVSQVGDESSVSQALDLINPASGVDEVRCVHLSSFHTMLTFLFSQSIESRESAALALREIRVPTTVKTDRFARLLLRLLQDDDPTVREYASDIVSRDWTRGVSVTERRSVELILAEVGPTKLELVKEEFGELDTFSVALRSPLTGPCRLAAADLALLSNPSSLLFAIEKPNIFKDDLLELDLLPSTDSSSSVSQALRDLEQALAQNPRGEGPFGLLGNELVCKWAARLTRAVESEDELVERLKRSLTV